MHISGKVSYHWTGNVSSTNVSSQYQYVCGYWWLVLIRQLPGYWQEALLYFQVCILALLFSPV